MFLTIYKIVQIQLSHIYRDTTLELHFLRPFATYGLFDKTKQNRYFRLKYQCLSYLLLGQNQTTDLSNALLITM